MQFVIDGPDIPDSLLQAHEEGRVVFFCGAGISYPAGLPGFKELVTEIYRVNGTEFHETERAAFDRGQYDATLDLLERRLPDTRLDLRRALAPVLKPKVRRKGAIDTHTALLRLARDRQGSLRLVTTNFDRLFHLAAKRMRQPFQAYAAPTLPIPKNSRWDGLVYLHGLLPEDEDATGLNRLVITSGDFGLAYLAERWAARFVSELFRNYVVCFIGYSINDPVLRYMMDALAADRMLGEVTPQAWALGDCEPGQEHRKDMEWRAKGVTPILYTIPPGRRDHTKLHQALHAWAEIYRDGVQGKEAIVVKHALTHPQASTPQDDFVGRMLWALSDQRGLPAKYFADLNPAPPLDWLLKAFTDARFGHGDLARFSVPPRAEVDDKLRFSLVRRPASYQLSPQMLLVSNGMNGSEWDEVMVHLGRWLTRHLDDPRLIIWIAEHGGQVHATWSWQIEKALSHIATLERDGKSRELADICANAPKAVPSPLMRTLWRILLSGRVQSSRPDSDARLLIWRNRWKREGLTASLRLELRALLAPRVALKKPFRWRDGEPKHAESPTCIGQLVDWELVLVSQEVHTLLNSDTDAAWQSSLPQLLDDLEQLLRDALDLILELGGGDERNDRSHWDLPSITPHWQNRGFHPWVTLIELLRDAWLAVRSTDSVRATLVARYWFTLPYATFKRLALFAASHDDCIPSEQWVAWLLTDEAHWLWSTDTRREMFRLLVLQGRHLAGAPQERLEAAILAGPPREMYPSDWNTDEWKSAKDHTVWLRLAKLHASGLAPGEVARVRLAELSGKNPSWRLATNERDEFSHWMSGSGDPDFEEFRDLEFAPRKRQELVAWLVRPPPARRPFYEDTWRTVCRTRFFHSLTALCDLAGKSAWPEERWREALQTWSEEGMVSRSWRYAAPLVQSMPDRVLQGLAQAVSGWILEVSSFIVEPDDILLNLCQRVLALPLEPRSGFNFIRNGVEIYDPVIASHSHPIGHVTKTLIHLWLKTKPNDGSLLPAETKRIFTELCDVKVIRVNHGRVLLASHLITLFRVDRPWTEQHLLPLLNWEHPAEARAMWGGFLWSPRFHPPLFTAFKSQFLYCASYYDELGEYRENFVTLLTEASLGPAEGYSVDELRSAFQALPPEGLQKAAQVLAWALASAAEQREDYWRNRVGPFWQSIWPKSRTLATPKIAVSLTRLVIAAGEEFSAAVRAVQAWLRPIPHLHYEIELLRKSGLCSKFPKDALVLLDAIVDNQLWAPGDLRQCLDEIVGAANSLAQDRRYQRLREYSRRRGQD